MSFQNHNFQNHKHDNKYPINHNKYDKYKNMINITNMVK
jgi:hypothetical protein